MKKTELDLTYMCGIVGYIGARSATPILISGLKRLEYRGYDSAGVAVSGQCGIEVRRAAGKIARLDALLTADPLEGQAGIGHTRWASHGGPSLANAHPHTAGEGQTRVSVVHNGIIENHEELRAELEASGAEFSSQTDTETICQLAHRFLKQGMAPAAAAQATFGRLEGSYATALLFEADPDHLHLARQGSPLVIGHGEGEMFLGSDAIALAGLTRRVTYLEEGDTATLSRMGCQVRDASGQSVHRPETLSSVSAGSADLGDYAHYMRKEIDEQPTAIAALLAHYLPRGEGSADVAPIEIDFSRYDRILMVACGTAFYACLTARYWFEKEAGIPVDLDIASEFRYREPPIPARTLAIFVSQSGETADTLAALRFARGRADTVLSLVNAPESSIARESDIVLPLLAGPEIGVASTKAFTSQLVLLAILSIKASQDRAGRNNTALDQLRSALRRLPDQVQDAIALEPVIQHYAAEIAAASDAIFLGRGALYPIALEGALKLKEITYIHAEGYASGELKHGPIALIEPAVPVIALAPDDALSEKSLSNVQEVMARDGQVLMVGPAGANLDVAGRIDMPDVDPFTAPILYAVPMQLLSYHAALARGTDVDQPRNLSKSVSIE